MAANGKPGVRVLLAIALVAGIAWWVAQAQVGQAGSTPVPITGQSHEPQAQPRGKASRDPAKTPTAAGAQATPTTGPGHEFQDAGERHDTIDCMAFLGRCNQRVQACETARAQCESQLDLAHQQLQDAYAQIADLQPKAALPVCSDRKDWIHATLPTVHCYPYACGDTPFSCTQACNSRLDCAPGRSCTAEGTCMAPID
jgi:hypothetical protein